MNFDDLKDTLGVSQALLALLEEDGQPKAVFYKALLDEVLESRHIDLEDRNALQYERLLRELRTQGAPLTGGRAERAILQSLERVTREGDVPALVDLYVQRKELREANFTPAVRQAMVDYLLGLELQIQDAESFERFQEGAFDEYFALAYHHAAATASANNDPIDATRARGSIIPWNFEVDTFESIEEQGVVPENCLAAGALDYVYEIGERMGAFRLADALVLNWASGAIDVVEGGAANRLYRYWKLRDERTSPEERAMVFRRVLSKGDAKMLSRMVVNEHVPELWTKLMTEAAEYISKSEEASSLESNLVSRGPIYQATRELQYNLTEFCTGMAHLQATEMYAQLKEALDILGDEEIVDHFGGGRRKTMWTVIERLSKAEFGAAPNIAAVRTAAVEGNKVFRWIAEFDQGTVTDARFRSFLESAEAYILAKGVDDTDALQPAADTGEEDDFAEDGADDFSDFDA